MLRLLYVTLDVADARPLQTIVNGMLSLACESKRTGDLFGNKNLFARASKIVGGLKARDAVALARRRVLSFLHPGRG